MSTTVTPEGDMVASKAEGLKRLLKQAIQESPDGLTVDMASVGAIDSVGLGVLIAAHNSLAKQGGALALANVRGDVLKLVKAMRLDRHFHVNA